jgi:hypothetical protein
VEQASADKPDPRQLRQRGQRVWHKETDDAGNRQTFTAEITIMRFIRLSETP